MINIVEMGEGETFLQILSNMIAMPTILAEYYVMWTFEERSCKCTHTYAMCLSVITIVVLEERVYLTCLHYFHKINHIL